MLLFDLCTLVLLLAVISILQAVILVFFSRLMQQRYAGVSWWAWASISNALGFVLLLLRDVIPDVWSVVVANTLLVSSTALTSPGSTAFWAARKFSKSGSHSELFAARRHC
jgi:hypothetical protein